MTSQEIIHAIAVYAVPVLFAISLHEAAHGYVARYFGDPTAAEAGRLTANPIRHIDLFGTILLPTMLALAHIVPFGYAKPVPVDFNRLRNPRKQSALVAFAGPMANFAMGLCWMIAAVLLPALGLRGPFLMEVIRAGVFVNAAMFVFNLIPIPPLDGGRILTSLLPIPLANKFAGIERYSLLVFVGLIALMQFRLLDGFLIGAMRIVVALFGLLVLPLHLLLN